MPETQDLIEWADESQKAFKWVKILHDTVPVDIDVLGIGDAILEEMPEVHKKVLELAINLEVEPGEYGEIVLDEKAILDGVYPQGVCPVDGSRLTYQEVVGIYRKESVPREDSPAPIPPIEPGIGPGGYTYEKRISGIREWYVPIIDVNVISGWPHTHTILMSVEPWAFDYSDGISGGKYICHPKAAKLLMQGGYDFVWQYYWVEYFGFWSFYLGELYGVNQYDIYLGLKRDILSFMSYYSRFGDDDSYDKRLILQPGFSLPGYLIASPGENARDLLQTYLDISEFEGLVVPLPPEPTPQNGLEGHVYATSSYGIHCRPDYWFNMMTDGVQTGCVDSGGCGIEKSAVSPGDSGAQGSWSLNVSICTRQIPNGTGGIEPPWYFPGGQVEIDQGGLIPSLTSTAFLRLLERKRVFGIGLI